MAITHPPSGTSLGSERRRRRTVGEELRLLVPLGVVWALGFTFVAVLTLGNTPSEMLFLDASYSSGARWYTGMVSNLGVLGWTAATASATWGSFVSHLGGRFGARDFLRAGAVVSALMLFDDLFQLHSDVLPNLVGMPKILALAIILGSSLLWLGQYPRELARTRSSVLAAGFFMLACSVVIDQLPLGFEAETSLIFEDGAKFLGILAWALYFVLTSIDIMRSVLYEASGWGATERFVPSATELELLAGITPGDPEVSRSQ